MTCARRYEGLDYSARDFLRGDSSGSTGNEINSCRLCVDDFVPVDGSSDTTSDDIGSTRDCACGEVSCLKPGARAKSQTSQPTGDRSAEGASADGLPVGHFPIGQKLLSGLPTTPNNPTDHESDRGCAQCRTMPVSVSLGKGIVPNVPIEVQRLWIFQIGVRHRFGLLGPVRACKPPLGCGEVPCPEVIEARFCISFFAGKLLPGIVGQAVERQQAAGQQGRPDLSRSLTD